MTDKIKLKTFLRSLRVRTATRDSPLVFVRRHLISMEVVNITRCSKCDSVLELNLLSIYSVVLREDDEIFSLIMRLHSIYASDSSSPDGE